MSKPQKPENRVKALEKKLADSRIILSAIGMMGLSDNFPDRLKEEIAKYLKSLE